MAELTAEEKAQKVKAEKQAKEKTEKQKAFDDESAKPGRYIVGDNLVDANNKVILPVPDSLITND